MALYRKWINEGGMHASWVAVEAISPLATVTMTAITVQQATSRQGNTRRAK